MKDSSTESALLRHARLQTIALYAILILLIAAVVFIALQAASLRSSIALLEDSLYSSVSELRDTLPQIDGEKITGLVSSLQDTSEKLADIDYTETINAMREAARTFSEIDVESLNALVNALEGVAERLQNASNAIAGFFGR